MKTASGLLLATLMLAACGGDRNETVHTTAGGTSAPVASDGSPRLVEIHPSSVIAGEPFGTLENGNSAMWMKTENARNGMYVEIDGQRMHTVVGSPALVTVEIPANFITHRGVRRVVLTDGTSSSNVLELTIE